MQKRNSRPAILHNKPNNQRASILHAALTENSRPPAGGYASVNRFARNGGRSLGLINPQNTVPTKPRNPSRTASQVKCSCSANTDNQVTYRRLSAVDRYIIAVRRCYRSIRRMQDRCSLFLWFAVWDSGSTIYFLHAAFLFAALCVASAMCVSCCD